MGKITVGLLTGLTFYFAACTTLSQKRNPAQEAPNPATNAINKAKATQHQGMKHVAHVPRTFTPVDTEGEEVEKEPTSAACGD